MAHMSKRLLRILLAGSALAAGFLAVDLLSSHDSASATDLVPDALSSVTTPLAPIVQVAAETSAPVVAPVASSIPPLVASLPDTVASSVLAPLEPAVAALTEPLAPVAHAALDPLVPALQPLLPVVVQLATAVQATPLATVTPAESTTIVGGGLILRAAIAASTAPLLPLPGNSPSPRNAPNGTAPASIFGFVAVAVAGFVAILRSALSAPALAETAPLSPTFASDTTPD